MDKTSYKSDQLLLAGLLAGEKPAYIALVNQYQKPLRRVACAIIGDAQAEEVVQDTLIAAIQQLQHFEGRSSLKTWLFTIASNQAKSRLRKDKREVYLDDIMEAENFSESLFKTNGHWAQAPSAWHDNSPETLLSYEDFRRCLDKTLQKLPDLQRAVLELQEYQDMELEDICNILNISASNIRVLVHRARAKVYAMVEHYEETGSC